MLAFAIPTIAGIVAALALLPSDLVAYLEGSLAVVVLVTGIGVGIVAAAVVTLLSGRSRKPEEQARPSPPPEPSHPSQPSPPERVDDAGQRLAMLSNLYDAITTRLVAVDAKVGEVVTDEHAAGEVRREIARLEQFLFDVHGVASLHDAEVHLEDIDPTALVESVIQRTGRFAGDRTLDVDITSPPGVLRADRKLLSLALINLVINAIKFSIPGAPIVVRVSEHGDRTLFEVEDQGPGIPPGEEVWGELARGSNAAGIPGAGLGLPLVRLAAEAHGGCARLDSTASGTTAVLEIPHR